MGDLELRTSALPENRKFINLNRIGNSIKNIQNDNFQPIQDVVRHIEQGYRMEPPEGCPLQISQLMGDTWALDPLSRPTFAEIVLRLKRLILQSTNSEHNN